MFSLWIEVSRATLERLLPVCVNKAKYSQNGILLLFGGGEFDYFCVDVIPL